MVAKARATAKASPRYADSRGPTHSLVSIESAEGAGGGVEGEEADEGLEEALEFGWTWASGDAGASGGLSAGVSENEPEEGAQQWPAEDTSSFRSTSNLSSWL